MNITSTLNEVVVKLFREINAIEENAIREEGYKDLSVNDIHVIEAIGIEEPKNMTSVAKALKITTGTLTISVNGLVKKGFVERNRSEEDRRVVLVNLTEKGRKAYAQHAQFHQLMINSMIEGLSQQEQEILQKALNNVMHFFRGLN